MKNRTDIYKKKIQDFLGDSKFKDVVILGTGPSLNKGIEYINSNNRDDLLVISINNYLIT